MLFQACPLLHRWSGNHEGAFDHFMKYKTRVPVCGAIMLNDTWDKACTVLLCLFHLHLSHVPAGRPSQGLEAVLGLGFP